MICLKKKHVCGMLIIFDTTSKPNLSHDRVWAENCFGRLCTFGSFVQKLLWNEELYGKFFCTDVALTNLQIMYIPLKADDAQFYRTVINPLFFTGSFIPTKRTATQLRYQET